MANYLEVKLVEESRQVEEHPRNLPFADSELFHSLIKEHNLLTTGEDVKTVYDVTIDLQGINYDYKPGDVIGILPENDEKEVYQLIDLLGLSSDGYYELSILKDTTKKKPVIPPHVPVHANIKELFMKYLDIRSVPKKLFLKSLLQHTTADRDKTKLNDICDPKQSNLYEKFINEEGRTLLHLLESVPTCVPPLERLLEHLPPLLPRYYSIASSPLLKNELRFAYTVIEFAGERGVCSGWIERLNKTSSNKVVPFYFRKSSNFLSIPNIKSDVVMIGPGTGVAPYVGFLQHRLLSGTKDCGQTILYYGCRYSNRDYLYKDLILRYLDGQVLNELEVTFSRETDKKMYVQDKILKNGNKIANMVLNKDVVICVCGDGKNMARDVEAALVTCLVNHGKLTKDEAKDFLDYMKKNNKYQLDVWI